MPSRATIAVAPTLVKWARVSAGLTVQKAARRAGIKAARLTEWEETAEARTTPRQLERLADACKRPVAAFFLPAPPTEPPPPLDFRIRPTADRPALSSTTLIAIRRTRRLQRLYADLDGDTRAAKTLPRLRLTDDPERAGGVMRAMLRVPPEASAGREPHEVLNLWRAAVEQRGVLVFQFGMPIREVRGFSLTDGVPAIVLNTKDHPHPRVFTLVHELTHLLVRQPGLCNPDEAIDVRQAIRTLGGETGRPFDAVEVFCNAVAGACLVPLDALLARPLVQAFQRERARLEDVVRDGVATFGVSRYVILRRLHTARALSQARYDQTVEVWRAEAGRAVPRRKRGGPAPAQRVVSELGRSFVSRVLRAHERQEITGADVADYLSIRLKHLPRVQALVATD